MLSVVFVSVPPVAGRVQICVLAGFLIASNPCGGYVTARATLVKNIIKTV